VLLLTALGILGTLLGASIVEYAVLSALGVMVLQVLAGLAVLRLPAAPGRFGLSDRARRIVGTGFVATSAVFGLLGAVQRPGLALAFGVAAGLGFLYYAARRGVLARRGIQLDHLITRRHAS
jgi:hypothetical protein